MRQLPAAGYILRQGSAPYSARRCWLCWYQQRGTYEPGCRSNEGSQCSSQQTKSEELCGRSDELQIETECCRDVEGGVRGVQSIVRKQCHGIEEGRPLEVSVRATPEGSSAELREEVQYVG